LFDVAKLSRHLEGLYRQMRDEYASVLCRSRVGNLDSDFEIGVAQDHEVREMGALTDYDGFYHAQLARRHYHQPMDADGRLWRRADRAAGCLEEVLEGRRERESLSLGAPTTSNMN